jgi:formylglycine-generating enzyme required for sulfatase activity
MSKNKLSRCVFGTGIYRLADTGYGNVCEWCWDWYGNYAGDAQTNPCGPVSGDYSVIHGGSWGGRGQYLRSAFRSFNYLSSVWSIFGFRLVRG